MNEERARTMWGKSRLPVLGLVILLIVVAPVMLLQRLSRANQNATDVVIHTHQVEAAVLGLALDVREMESAGMLIALGADHPLARQRLVTGRTSLPERFETLVRLTADNPEQLVRIGRLRELVDARIEVVDQLIEAPEAYRGSVVAPLATRFPIRGLLNDILNDERALLSQRTGDAVEQRKRIEWIRMIALGAQLLLLSLVLMSLGRQVARRLNAERKTAQASQRALVVLDTVREPIVLLDGEQHIQMHNAAFAELYGIEKDHRVPSLDDLGVAWQDKIMRQRLHDVLARGRELWDYELQQETADGLRRTVLLNARRMPLPDTDDHAVLVTVSDISLQKTAQLEIAALNRQLEGKVEQVSEVNRELEAFSYSVSHDLRAPLRHVAGFSDKLGRHLGDGIDDKSRHYLGVIGDSARRMSQLIDDLLVYSRLGRSALRLQAVDMQSLVAEARAMLDANEDNDGRADRVQWRIAPMPIVLADENMMRQVWNNLLGNALKYSSQRERSLIDVEHRIQEDGSHLFSVRDNGAGFDMAYAGKLFGVFQRLHKASDFPGTGIGLASVRRVIGRHGGRIWAESAPDEGATFYFTLPAALDAPPSREKDA
ncbi:PAS domain S-box-containing protein [Pseudoxanthomonas japonensis]|uniref:ATP-binding protein n=1 Tax=Pseudoxanthomonas TaxID=83618 RepID=UPI0007837323|nr:MULTISPECIES: ATP-binding protein [Pseudoxanthomonas]MBA3930900.1 PAS domain S-box protein [Xanthomonas sp.]MBL8257260.1 CHASE3 domain-containing protein [Pseudoxanthomonas mexicana]MDR7070738.1 PAS domain S-box-containing protein [Pseudoxanthomonas japonensis]